MPTMNEPRELFLHELGDMLYAEKAIEKTLPKLQKEASDRELAQGFAHHLDETKQQIANLERVFKAMGEPAKAEKCPGIEGIKEEHDQFMESEDPSDEICDLFLTGAAARTEHYEIAAYTGLVEMANALGESECAKLLGENLRQEQDMLQNVESSSKRLMKETLGAGSRT